MNAEVHVIFGTGPVGLATARALLKRSKPVRMINRSGRGDNVPPGVEVRAADAYSVSAAIEAAQGATSIYQCAQPAYHEWQEKFLPLQSAILQAAAALGARVAVADNLYLYGPVSGPMREDMPASQHTKKGRVRGEMAQAVMAAHQAGTIRAAIARASDFYGPTVRDSLVGDRLFEPLLKGKAAGMFGDVDLPHAITYIDDFGETLAVLGTRDEALGQIWHVPNDRPLTQREMVMLAARAAGVEPKIDAMGLTKLRIGGLFIPAARETVEMMYEFTQPFLVDDSRFRRAFPDVIVPGQMPMPAEEGFRRTVEWYRQQMAAHA
jgi:nucleoside-diphosphate-sugar epimerase